MTSDSRYGSLFPSTYSAPSPKPATTYEAFLRNIIEAKRRRDEQTRVRRAAEGGRS